MPEGPSIPRELPLAAREEGPPFSAPVTRRERLRAMPVTYSVMAVCVAVQLLAVAWGRGSDGVLWYMGANNGELVRAGELQRLLACTFLHGDWLHLGMNMFVLFALSSLELVLGWRRFLVLYAVSGLTGSLATALINPDTLSVGASGAIWGLMMATFGFRLAARRVLPGVSLSAGLSTLALNVFISFLPGVDTTAHFGGGIAGFALGASVLRPSWIRHPPARDPRDGKGRVLTAAAAAAALAMLASLLLAFAAGQPWRYADVPAARRVRIGETPLDIALPGALADDVQRHASGATFTYGGKRPVPVVLFVHTLPMRTPPELSLDDVIDGSYQDLRESPPEAGVKLTSLGMVTLDGHRVIREQMEVRNEERVRYHAFVPGYRVVFVFSRQAPDDVWPGVEERIVSSLRAI